MVKATATRKISNDKWLGDLGASSHMCNDMKYMGKSNPSDEKVIIGDLRWICELRWIDIIVDVAMLSRFLAAPRRGTWIRFSTYLPT